MQSSAISQQRAVLQSLPVRQFKTNSAEVESGDVFVCRQGISLDGHDFVVRAVNQGACAIIVNRPLQASVPVIVTDSYYQSLALIKAYYEHPHKAVSHIGVTGTNGKTTVSHCLNQILNLESRSAYIGTLGAQLVEEQVPLTNTTPDGVTLLNIFQQMRMQDTEFNVMELSSHALAQDRAGFVSLQVGVITNIGEDHLDFHRTKDSYIHAKLQLVDRIQSKGTLVVNLDDPHALAAIERVSEGIEVVTFSKAGQKADVVASNITSFERGMRFTLTAAGENVDVRSPMPFLYNVENALAIASTLYALGWSLVKIAQGIERIEMPEGRAQFVELPNDCKGLVDYAHNSDGLKALLEAVQDYVERRLIVVVGVTGDRLQQASEMGAICAKYADLIVFTSDNPMGVIQGEIFQALRSQVGSTPHFEISDRREAIKLAKKMSEGGDLVVVCGKGSETFQYLSDGKDQKQSYIGDLAALRIAEAL
ncbi:UDP-N-acetylmuramoyl-L-alanyl-D-glutamate--2,6-diaminopimelate ligase [Vibrio fortis]|uniref:UDP-N-acetylmuramoyl-L-alanyl-D-glutamate--2, 6-diaminopimelate ligase n=1 Tax=Vibrio fortis TaxID=212667 RepID=UPI003EBA4953